MKLWPTKIQPLQSRQLRQGSRKAVFSMKMGWAKAVYQMSEFRQPMEAFWGKKTKNKKDNNSKKEKELDKKRTVTMKMESKTTSDGSDFFAMNAIETSRNSNRLDVMCERSMWESLGVALSVLKYLPGKTRRRDM